MNYTYNEEYKKINFIEMREDVYIADFGIHDASKGTTLTEEVDRY